MRKASAAAAFILLRLVCDTAALRKIRALQRVIFLLDSLVWRAYGRFMKCERVQRLPNINDAGHSLCKRILFVSTSFLFLQIFVGCAYKRSDSTPWQNCSKSLGSESIASLNQRANDSIKPQAERASAVFTLFAQHIRPGSSVDAVRRVFTDTTWLREIHLAGVRELAGKVPVEYSLEDTVFCMHLFPAEAEEQWSPWVVYFRLSGQQRDEDGLAFLKGEHLAGNPKLLEFALCIPAPSKANGGVGRVEHFSAQEKAVFDE